MATVLLQIMWGHRVTLRHKSRKYLCMTNPKLCTNVRDVNSRSWFFPPSQMRAPTPPDPDPDGLFYFEKAEN